MAQYLIIDAILHPPPPPPPPIILSPAPHIKKPLLILRSLVSPTLPSKRKAPVIAVSPIVILPSIVLPPQNLFCCVILTRVNLSNSKRSRNNSLDPPLQVPPPQSHPPPPTPFPFTSFPAPEVSSTFPVPLPPPLGPLGMFSFPFFLSSLSLYLFLSLYLSSSPFSFLFLTLIDMEETVGREVSVASSPHPHPPLIPTPPPLQTPPLPPPPTLIHPSLPFVSSTVERGKTPFVFKASTWPRNSLCLWMQNRILPPLPRPQNHLPLPPPPLLPPRSRRKESRVPYGPYSLVHVADTLLQEVRMVWYVYGALWSRNLAPPPPPPPPLSPSLGLSL